MLTLMAGPLLVAFLLTAAAAQGAGANILTLAIFDFESKDEPVRDLGAKAAALRFRWIS